MYQITGNQASFRVTDVERDLINDVAEEIQESSGNYFTNAKQLLFGLIKKVQSQTVQLQELQMDYNSKIEELSHLREVPPTLPGIPEELKIKFEEIKQSVFEGEELSEETMLDTLVQIVNSPAPIVPQIEEKLVEKTIEVERKLSETEILIDLKPSQKNALLKIADWRFKNGYDNEELSPGEVMRKMTFNKGSLVNWHGEFMTGFSERHLKKEPI